MSFTTKNRKFDDINYIEYELNDTIKTLIIQAVKEPERKGYINEIIADSEKQIDNLIRQINEMKNSKKIGKSARERIKTSAEILDMIIEERNLSNAHLHLLSIGE